MPYIVKDIFKGGDPSISNLINVNGILYFTAYDTNYEHGYELWRSDGTAAGTYIVKDINPGSGGSDAAGLINVNGTLFFSARDANFISRLWKSDGTEAGTVIVSTDVSTAGLITNVNGTVYFVGSSSGYGSELWKSDGTAAGTKLVKDINPGTGSPFIYYLTNINGTLYFRTNFNSVMSLWKSDGSESGTIPLKQINSPYADMRNFTDVNGTLFLTIDDTVHGSELWKSNGTEAGTAMVKEINPGIEGANIGTLITLGNLVYFSAYSPTYGQEMWQSDGTEAGTKLVKDIYQGENSSYLQLFCNINGTLLFTIDDGINGRELWKSDGTPEGTELVKDVYSGSMGSSIYSFANVNGTFYFSASTGSYQPELWKSDGTEAGTVMIKIIPPGSNYQLIDYMTDVDGKLFFIASTSIGTNIYNSTLWSLGTCTPANTGVNSIEKASPFNTQTQSSSNTTCYCNVFNELITTIEATGDAPVSGNVFVKEWMYPPIDGNYVPRQYELYPETDPDIATAKVTLYYTQSDFTQYNGYASTVSALKLPVDSSDTKGINNIRIEKRGGTSSTDSGWPMSYPGTMAEINPDDVDIIWNSAAKRWEVSFETTGMGGYIIRTLTLTDPSDVSVSETAICSGTAITLSATCAQGTLNWYTSASGGTSIGTSSALILSPTVTTTYYAACEYDLSSTIRAATSEVVVTTMPTAPEDVTIDKSSICSGSTVSLTATCPIGTVKWYTQLSGGSAIGTASSLQVSPPYTTTYYVACENGNCQSERVLVGELTVTAQPSNPTSVSIDQKNVCSNWFVNFSATCDYGNATWYKGEYDLTSVATSGSWGEVPGITTSYYVACENGDCKSERVSAGTVTVSEQPVDPTDVSVSEMDICSGTTITLSASCSIGTATWYAIGAEEDVLIGTGASLSQTPVVSTKYFVACENGICVSDRVITEQVTVRPTPAKPANLSLWSTTVCSGMSNSLSGSCSSGTLKWYDSATATTAAYEGGTVYISINKTTTFYAACETTYCSSERVAMEEIVFYTKPVNPTGLAVSKTAICNGDSITLTGSCSIGSIKWIRTYSTGGVEQYDLIPTYTPTETSVYYAYCMNGTCISDYLPAEAVVVTEKPTNPTDLFQGGTQLCAGTGIYLNASCATGTLNWYDSATGATVLGTGTFFIGRPTITTTFYVACENATCKSARVALNEIVVYQQPVNPTGVSVSKTAICNGETITLSGSCLIGTLHWYKTSMDPDTAFTYKPKVNTVYHASCGNEFCVSASVATAEVAVTQQPTNPTNVGVSTDVICKGEDITLTANCTVGTVTWYTSATGTTVVGTGNNLSQTPASNTKYYAACVNGMCNSGRIVTDEVTVKAKPVTPVISGRNTICAGESITLSSSAPAGNPDATFHWSGGATGISLIASPATTTNYRAVTSYDGCNSDSSVVFTITVNRVPEQPAITADNATICKGNTVILTGQCLSITDSFYWTNSTTTNTNSLQGTYYKNTRQITEPGTYKGWCESNTGCKGVEKSITINPGTNCNGKNFITITPAKPVVCQGSSITLTAAGCTGTVSWLGGVSTQTGTSISVKPTANTTYFVQCSAGGSATVDITVATSAVVMSANITTGNELIKAVDSIESSKKIGDPDFSPAPVVTFEAGKSILLKPGFIADAKSVFKAEIKGCN